MSLAPSYTTPQEVEDLQLRVSLSSSAGRINLWPNAKGDGFKLHTKVDGLGVADSVNTMTSLPSGGAVLRHQRLKEGDMFLPIQIRSNSKKARNDLKTKLEQILTPAKGPVKVEVMDPYTKDTRSRTTYYRTGLGAPDWSGPNSALYGITLDYAEPWWRGAVRSRKVKVADRKKPFLTGRVKYVEDPDTIVQARKNWVTNPSLEKDSTNWSAYSWTGSGTRTQGTGAFGSWFYRLKATATLTGNRGRYYDHEVPVPANSVWTVSMHVRPSRTVTMQMQGEFRVEDGAVGATAQAGPAIECPANVWTQIYVTLQAEGNATLVRSQAYLRGATLQSGDTLDLDGETVTAGGIGSYFDGSTPASDGNSYGWLGAANESTSEETTHGTKMVGVGPATPFFPTFIYSSVVQGVYTLNIEGDEESWPTWEISGPGKDMLIENTTTGEALFIEGEIFETINIVTDPQRQDIYSDTWTDGQWWDRVDIKRGSLFPLRAGENQIRITMVGATQASYVKYAYEEMWGSAY